MNGILLAVLLSWLAVVIFSAITISYIKKRKDSEVSSGDSKSKKEYDAIVAFQVIQIVLGSLGVLMTGSKLLGHQSGKSPMSALSSYLSGQ